MRRIWLSLILLLYAAVAAAADITRIDILAPAANPALDGLVEAVRRELQQQLPDYSIVVRTNTEPDTAAANRALLVSIGESLLPWIYSEKNNYAATINFYINSINANTERSFENKVSALYRDQPLTRQLRLAKLLIPQTRKAALLYENTLPTSIDRLQREADIETITMRNTPDWAKNLSRALEDSDILLGIDDPGVYNGETIHSILLTAYRHNKVLIGPSRPFVNAGSLASCYTSLADYLQQLGAMVKTRLQQGRLPKPQYPRVFHVAINSQVAVSLHLSIPDEKTLSAWAQNQTGECDDGC